VRAAPRSDRAGIVYLHKGRRRKPPMAMLLVAAIVFLPFVPAGAVAASALYAGYRYYTATVRAANLPHLQPYAFQDARIYDRHGTLLYEVGDPLHGERRPVPLAAVPHALQQATIAIEDKTFYANPGFDVRGVARAARENLMVGHVVEGGSSITQQLVKTMLLSGEPTR
jgi:membrane peptidoglycan carboxypeptidase